VRRQEQGEMECTLSMKWPRAYWAQQSSVGDDDAARDGFLRVIEQRDLSSS
jgi:hypothetical protein